MRVNSGRLSSVVLLSDNFGGRAECVHTKKGGGTCGMTVGSMAHSGCGAGVPVGFRLSRRLDGA